MCAQFILKTEANEISKRLGLKIHQPLKDWDLRARGFIKTELAPVIIFKDNNFQLKEMSFSLCPSWSEVFPCKWSTYNARMERANPKDASKVEFIYQVPTWRQSFSEGKTCLVPMNAAIESSYFGTQAGNMIQLKVKDEQLFFVVGLWSEWVDKNTGEVKESFTLITDDPYPFFFECGHDRSVFVLNEFMFKDWLSDKDLKPKERFDFLRENRVTLDWEVSVDRPMAKSWEKSRPSEKDLKAIKIWEA